MYPLGVIGELMTIYAALPYVRKAGMYSLRLPNKYNVSFDYYYFLIIVMLSYIPRKNHSLTHSRTAVASNPIEILKANNGDQLFFVEKKKNHRICVIYMPLNFSVEVTNLDLLSINILPSQCLSHNIVSICFFV